MANFIGALKLIDPPHMVPIQLNTFIPVGIAMSAVVSAKNFSTTSPVTNMWCAQTDKLSTPMASVANTRSL